MTSLGLINCNDGPIRWCKSFDLIVCFDTVTALDRRTEVRKDRNPISLSTSAYTDRRTIEVASIEKSDAYRAPVRNDGVISYLCSMRRRCRHDRIAEYVTKRIPLDDRILTARETKRRYIDPCCKQKTTRRDDVAIFVRRSA